jgi:hypothetical protein
MRFEKTALCRQQPRTKSSELPGALAHQSDNMGLPILWVTLLECPAIGFLSLQKQNHQGFFDLDQFAEPPLNHHAKLPKFMIEKAIEASLYEHASESAGSKVIMYHYQIGDYAKASTGRRFVVPGQWHPAEIREYRKSRACL